jgi:hypothetical protein
MVWFHSFGTPPAYVTSAYEQNVSTETLCLDKLRSSPEADAPEADDMAEQPHRPDTDPLNRGRGGDLPPPMPRWVWVSAIVVGALIAVAVVVMLISGGQHGPGLHSWIGVAPGSGSGDIAIAVASARG